MELPKFKYHPDPLKTGSVRSSDVECECCNKETGYIYVGPVFSEEELNDCICPWCIASGKANEMFGAEFTDYDAVGDYGGWVEVSDDIKEEVSCRTPGFSGWQQEKWWTHCGDAAAYVGRAGNNEVSIYDISLMEALQEDSGLSGKEWEEFQKCLDKDGSPTAYVFQCLRCGKYGGYQDCD